jgi:Helix-turn-helix domain
LFVACLGQATPIGFTARQPDEAISRGADKSHERHALLQAITADRKAPGNAVRLAVTLMAFVNNATGLCCPSQEKIRDRCHLSRNTIDSMARVLERQGWLRIERRERSYTRYHFMFDRIREGGDYYGQTIYRSNIYRARHG